MAIGVKNWKRSKLYLESKACGERHPDAIALAMDSYAAGVRDGERGQVIASNTAAVHLCGEIVARRTRMAKHTSHRADEYRAQGAREVLDALVLGND